jgi:hypothetical protein
MPRLVRQWALRQVLSHPNSNACIVISIPFYRDDPLVRDFPLLPRGKIVGKPRDAGLGQLPNQHLNRSQGGER